MPWASHTAAGRRGSRRPGHAGPAAASPTLARRPARPQPDDPQGARLQVPAIIDNLLRAGEGKTLRKLRTIVSQVNSIEEDFRALSDAELRAMTDELKHRYEEGQSLDELLPEAFATVREAAHRVIGQRHFDVQL